ncbi:MAG: UbiA-like polyprenyltransferase [Phycisphaerales bacterium]|nr:UbiA-like polyprenyltransferase [Phycisphaerales bacterium]
MNSTAVQKISNYLSLIKFSHTVFALPFAFIGFAIAIYKDHYHFEYRLLFLMLLCMFFARSAAMAFNRFIDRKFDALNPRTANREIPAGVIRPKNALIFVLLSSLLFIATTFFINKLCFYLSPIALFLVLFYSYTKRFTALCHIVLGVSLSLAPLGAYLAVTSEFNLLPILFSLLVLTWVSGFDIIYALKDEFFDRSQNLHSIPALLGTQRALFVSNLLHIGTAILVIYVGLAGQMGTLYWFGAVIYIAMLIYQHFLVRPNDLSKVNIAFINTNSIASICFALFTIASLMIQ